MPPWAGWRGGVLILDNADWLPESSRLLREAGLLEIDMTGFVPIGGYTQTTSLFFDRSFDFPRRPGSQPQAGIGARGYQWEGNGRPPGRRVECEGEQLGGVTSDVTCTLETGDGRRTFRLLVYTMSSGRPRIAILDLDRTRVLLTQHSPAGRVDGPADLQREIDRIRELSWEQFRAFIRDHPKRRYVPEAVDVGARTPVAP